MSPISPSAVNLCALSAHTLPVTTTLSHVLIWMRSLAAARAARSLATFCAGVSAFGIAGRSDDGPPPIAPLRVPATGPGFSIVLKFGLGFSGVGRDESDGGGFCGVLEGESEGENVEAAGREERTGGFEKACGGVEVKRVASVAEEEGRKRMGVRRILYCEIGDQELVMERLRSCVREMERRRRRLMTQKWEYVGRSWRQLYQLNSRSSTQQEGSKYI